MFEYLLILGPNHTSKEMTELIRLYKDRTNNSIIIQKESIKPQDLKPLANGVAGNNRMDIFFHGEHAKGDIDSEEQHYIVVESRLKDEYLETKLFFRKLAEQNPNTPLDLSFWSCYGNLAAKLISELPPKSILITHANDTSLVNLEIYAASHQIEPPELPKSVDALTTRWLRIYQNLQYDYLVGPFTISYINEDRVVSSFKWINNTLPALCCEQEALHALHQAFYDFLKYELKLPNVLELNSLMPHSKEDKILYLWSILANNILNLPDSIVKENLLSITTGQLNEVINLKVNGSTLLSIAAYQGITTTTKLLLQKGADPNINNPLHFAAENDHPEIIKILLDHKADTKKMSDREDTLLHTACRNGSLNTVELLFNLNVADNEALNAEGYKPSTVAILRGHLEVIKLMLNFRCNIVQDLPDTNNILIIASCAEKNECEIIKLLIERKLIKDINSQNVQGITALTNAVILEKPDIVSYLLNCNADPAISLNDGFTAYDLAKEKNNTQIMELLGTTITSAPE